MKKECYVHLLMIVLFEGWEQLMTILVSSNLCRLPYSSVVSGLPSTTA